MKELYIYIVRHCVIVTHHCLSSHRWKRAVMRPWPGSARGTRWCRWMENPAGSFPSQKQMLSLTPPSTACNYWSKGNVESWIVFLLLTTTLFLNPFFLMGEVKIIIISTSGCYQGWGQFELKKVNSESDLNLKDMLFFFPITELEFQLTSWIDLNSNRAQPWVLPVYQGLTIPDSMLSKPTAWSY